MSRPLSDDLLREIQLAAAAHARMKLAFEHDRRSLAQRMRRDRINHWKGKA